MLLSRPRSSLPLLTRLQPCSLQSYSTDAAAQHPLLQSATQRTTDHLTFNPTDKLNATLLSFFPKWAQWYSRGEALPLGYHQIYCNPSPETHTLLPDGTDTSFSPGEPFTRRMWAGGSLKLNTAASNIMRLDSQKCVCVESVRGVTEKGAGTDNPKLFVDMERKFITDNSLTTSAAPLTDDEWRKLGVEDPDWRVQQMHSAKWHAHEAALVERRTIVFLKSRPEAELEACRRGEAPPIKYLDRPAEKPDLRHSLTPTAALLFRFSALTFNAHKIHLDPEYTRNVEGHRNLLVHGPLSLTLMLTLLQQHLRIMDAREIVASIDYRNLAPLYCDEEMHICVRRRKEKIDMWDVWIEGPTGGVAVKGTCRTEKVGTTS
ncbi:hypothetical protein GQ43DRAFT_436671 [Delitschia confertaspora ATCC 74209]|uniref:MaoC-like protein n=1 Tax=Delitschia confertaspora ATCC 74209 TaxID=1513339 RepID=A0A9P4JUG1_9PLEO|nr:hypothetical protein GQ43DRAFT_436671 [Delitschia confertaspora ATCC 74209]